MSILKDNPLLIIVVMAILAVLTIVLTGHAVDGKDALSSLYTLIALASAGHLALPTTVSTPPGDAPKNPPAP